MPSPDLSIVVPVLNEAETLDGLFAALAAQQGIDFEVVLSDGGSTDGTVREAERLSGELPFSIRVIRGPKGRGRQLNAGAVVAKGDTLLFLHADSRFTDPLALARGVAALEERIVLRGDERVAGHFGLRFERKGDTASFGYVYYETKARLDRPGCTHGDQGFLLRRRFFREVGPFDESLPVLEDTHLAEKIRRDGEWLLLPAEIRTSARRFETEGLRARQTLNALIMNFAAIGWDAFFGAAPEIYRCQDGTGPLQLYPFLSAIRDLLRPLPASERLRLWRATGRYVRSNAWQLALALEVLRSFRSRGMSREADFSRLALFDRWFDRLTDHPPGRLATAALVWVWFRSALFCLGLRARPDAAERPEARREPS